MASYEITQGGVVFRISAQYAFHALGSNSVKKLEVYSYGPNYSNEIIIPIADNLNITDPNTLITVKVPYSELPSDLAYILLEGYDNNGNGENISGGFPDDLSTVKYGWVYIDKFTN